MNEHAKQLGLSRSGWYHRVAKFGKEGAIAQGPKMKKGANSPWRNGPMLKTAKAIACAKRGKVNGGSVGVDDKHGQE